MQFNRYRFSIRSQNQLGQLKHKTGLSSNILARYAVCLSLKDPSIPNPDEYDEKGMEILPSVLFGEYENIYMTLIINRLHRDGLAPKKYLHSMTRAHFNRGIVALFPRIQNISDFNDMIQQEKNE